jgi:hypothetical protein
VLELKRRRFYCEYQYEQITWDWSMEMSFAMTIGEAVWLQIGFGTYLIIFQKGN